LESLVVEFSQAMTVDFVPDDRQSKGIHDGGLVAACIGEFDDIWALFIEAELRVIPDLKNKW